MISRQTTAALLSKRLRHKTAPPPVIPPTPANRTRGSDISHEPRRTLITPAGPRHHHFHLRNDASSIAASDSSRSNLQHRTSSTRISITMSSFDQLSSLEAGRGSYSDDPQFKQQQQQLKNRLILLRQNISRLGTEVNHLGGRRDTPRVRERVHSLLEESRELCKEIGEGVKKLQAWGADLTVC